MARPVHADADATRARILSSAHHLFATQGTGSTSIRDVARGAGVSLAMVHHYFGSKQQLFDACVDAMYVELAELRRELEAKLAGSSSLSEALERAVLESYDFARRHRDAVRLMIRVTVDAGQLPEERRTFHLGFLAQGTEMLAKLTGKKADDLRLPLQTLVFLVARYAVESENELSAVVNRKSAREAHAAVGRHLWTIARDLLGDRTA